MEEVQCGIATRNKDQIVVVFLIQSRIRHDPLPMNAGHGIKRLGNCDDLALTRKPAQHFDGTKVVEGFKTGKDEGGDGFHGCTHSGWDLTKRSLLFSGASRFSADLRCQRNLTIIRYGFLGVHHFKHIGLFFFTCVCDIQACGDLN